MQSLQIVIRRSTHSVPSPVVAYALQSAKTNAFVGLEIVPSGVHVDPVVGAKPNQIPSRLSGRTGLGLCGTRFKQYYDTAKVALW